MQEQQVSAEELVDAVHWFQARVGADAATIAVLEGRVARLTAELAALRPTPDTEPD